MDDVATGRLSVAPGQLGLDGRKSVNVRPSVVIDPNNKNVLGEDFNVAEEDGVEF